jgi:hypothetical protein
MPSPLETEHHDLLTTATGLIESLEAFGGQIQSGDVTYEQHRVYATRGNALALQCRGVMQLLVTEMYGQAFGLLRPALEQIVLDNLLCLASKYVLRYEAMSPEVFESWRADWQRRAPGTESIQKMQRNPKTGVAHVALRGLTSSTPDMQDMVLSAYYFMLQEFQPFVMPPGDQEHLLPGMGRDDRQRRYAKEQQALYEHALSWQRLLYNLQLNDLVSPVDLLRIRVHYRFLSAFAHPLKDHQRTLYGHQPDFLARPRYDHYSSELALLYLAAFAVYELETLLRAGERPPTFTVAGVAHLRARIMDARRAAEYLWFVGDPPSRYDYIQEANHRYWASAGHQQPPPDWGTLGESEVHYYQDPLRRIIGLHKTTNEGLGHSYQSSWHRDDAWNR